MKVTCTPLLFLSFIAVSSVWVSDRIGATQELFLSDVVQGSHPHRQRLIDEEAVRQLETIDSFPPLKDICDQYENSPAKGLCASYCEGKDCDEDINQDLKDCTKIKKNFTKITGETTFPCEGRCPCWTSEYVNQIGDIWYFFSHYSRIWVFNHLEGTDGILRTAHNSDDFFCFLDSMEGIKITESEYEVCHGDIVGKYYDEGLQVCERGIDASDNVSCPCWEPGDLPAVDNIPTETAIVEDLLTYHGLCSFDSCYDARVTNDGDLHCSGEGYHYNVNQEEFNKCWNDLHALSSEASLLECMV